MTSTKSNNMAAPEAGGEKSRHDIIQECLIESGGRVAAVSERFMHGQAEAGEFLETVATHIDDLAKAGQFTDAFATGVMALVTAFRCRFSPRQCAVPYLMTLLGLAVNGAVAQQMAAINGDSFASGHFEAIDAELGPLVYASYRELGGEELLPEDVRAPFASLADWTDPDAEFQGRKITAALAPDILCDIASRLTALGAIE